MGFGKPKNEREIPENLGLFVFKEGEKQKFEREWIETKAIKSTQEIMKCLYGTILNRREDTTRSHENDKQT
jgi:hypothetical protein